VLADLDNDGDLDLVHTNNKRSQQGGYVTTPPVTWYSEDGTFHRLAGRDLGFRTADGRGIARLDFDRDGDLDLIIADNQGQYRLYENRQRESNTILDPDRHAIQLRIVGDTDHVAIGARVSVTAGGRTQYRIGNARADYLSQESRVLHVGVGSHETIERIRITWPDGTEHTLRDVAADRRLYVYPNGTVRAVPFQGGPSYIDRLLAPDNRSTPRADSS